MPPKRSPSRKRSPTKKRLSGTGWYTIIGTRGKRDGVLSITVKRGLVGHAQTILGNDGGNINEYMNDYSREGYNYGVAWYDEVLEFLADDTQPLLIPIILPTTAWSLPEKQTIRYDPDGDEDEITSVITDKLQSLAKKK